MRITSEQPQNNHYRFGVKMNNTNQTKRVREETNDVNERPLKKIKAESAEKEEKNDSDPFTTINLRDGGVFRYDNDFLSQEEAQNLFDKLFNELEWKQSDIKMYGKVLKSPRMQCWMSNNGVDADVYLKTKATPWREDILEIKTRLEKLLNCKFDYLLFNLYRNGNDYIGYHADREAIPKGKGVIASLSLGATRKFVIKHRQTNEKHELNLNSGNLVVMDGITQKYWKHAVPKQAKVTEPRINLTFRIS